MTQPLRWNTSVLAPRRPQDFQDLAAERALHRSTTAIALCCKMMYDAVCCDITNPVIPGTGTIKFEKRSVGEILHWIFVGN